MKPKTGNSFYQGRFFRKHERTTDLFGDPVEFRFRRSFLIHAASASQEVIPLWHADQVILLHDVNTEHEAEDEFVSLKQTTCDVTVDGECAFVLNRGKSSV